MDSQEPSRLERSHWFTKLPLSSASCAMPVMGTRIAAAAAGLITESDTPKVQLVVTTMNRFKSLSERTSLELTHVQEVPQPGRPEHPNLDPLEQTPHPTVRRGPEGVARIAVGRRIDARPSPPGKRSADLRRSQVGGR
jgi:hypothetical protein